MKKITQSLIVALSFLVFFGCKNQSENKQKPQAAPPTFPVAKIKPKNITGHKEYPVNIEGIVNSAVRAKTSGYIQNVLVDEGEKVRKGQALFKLETQSLSQDANAAKANVNAAQVEVDKLIPLVEKNIISKVQLETAKANLAKAKATYQSILANIDYATVKSPINGYVGTINFREGSLVSPNDATPLTTVSDISRVYAFFSLNETQYLDFLQNADGKTLKEKLTKYPPVNLILANGSTYSEKGKIQTASAQVNQTTGTVSFRAVFENPNQLLTNGNSGKIQIPTVYKNAIVVPQSATFDQQGNILLFKLNKNNTVTSSIVKVKADIGNLYVLESGIDTTDKIVVSGVGKLRSDMAITPKEVVLDSVIKPITPLFKN